MRAGWMDACVCMYYVRPFAGQTQSAVVTDSRHATAILRSTASTSAIDECLELCSCIVVVGTGLPPPRTALARLGASLAGSQGPAACQI